MMTREEALNRLRLIAQRAFEAAIDNRRGKGEEAQKDLDAIDFAIATMQSKASLLVRAEGCALCYVCGHSKCS
jgi:hypothetical protein